MSQVKEAQQALFRYELLRDTMLKVKNDPKYRSAFEKVEALEAEMKEVQTELKRIFSTKDGPPKDITLKEGKSTYVWASGRHFNLAVVYPKAADYYDPAKLPLDVLAKPNVVELVRTTTLDSLAKKDKRIAFARVTGAWATPRVSLTAITVEGDDGAQEE